MTENPRGAMFRVIAPDRPSRVTNAELFFDLVFVYAVTQLSHALLGNFTLLGVVQNTLLFLAVWWTWVYTAWITNWLDPEQTPVRILLFLLMLGGLVLSTSIPTAFGARGLWFAIAYAAMQVGRTLFWLLATPPERTLVRHNAVRILVWLSASAVVLGARRLRRGREAALALGRGAFDRICRAGGALLDARAGLLFGRGLGGRGWPHGRALRRLHHHCARRGRCGQWRDFRRSRLDP
jgi:hypothetical protein